MVSYQSSAVNNSWSIKKKVLTGLSVIFLLVLIAIGIAAYMLYKSVSANPEETAKFIPPETVVFFSVNLPSMNQ